MRARRNRNLKSRRDVIAERALGCGNMKPVSMIIEINFHVPTPPDDTTPYVDAAREQLVILATRYDIDEWEYNSTEWFDTILTVQFQRDF